MVVHPTIDLLSGGLPPGASADVHTESLAEARSAEEVFKSFQGNTIVHAQMYVDSARCLADFDQLGEAERHLREAMNIASRAGASTIARADIRSFLAILIDRNTGRKDEAEQEYRTTLEEYKGASYSGRNASITLHNLKEHLASKGRTQDIDSLETEYPTIRLLPK